MKEENKESGQALIELIIFLPLMFMLYSLISGFANSINGSINQQKITRSYFYFRAQNNSTIPKPDENKNVHRAWSKFGMFFIGWKEKFAGGDSESGQPVMPCYRISIPFTNGEKDCDQKYNTQTTQFIRVATVYGMCGATYANIEGGVVLLPDHRSQNFMTVIDPSACTISR